MAHERDALWAFACGELSREDAARVAAHVALCGDCAQALDEVRTAQGLLAPAAVPALGAQRWSALDGQVLAAAEQAMARPRWLAGLVEGLKAIPVGAWAGAAVAAGVTALVLFWPSPPVAHVTPPVALAPPVPVAPPPVPVPAPAPTSQVLVASARHARSNGAAVGARAALSEGSALSTERQGELWLSLPDGSRAGLMGGATLHLDRAARDDVRVRVEHGTLLVAAAQGAARPVSVRAGEVEIRVSASRVLVERDDSGVSVAVEDGVVEAEWGGALRRLTHGQSVRFENGRAQVTAMAQPQRVLLARLDAAPRVRPAVAEPGEDRALGQETPAIPGEAVPPAPENGEAQVPQAPQAPEEEGMTPVPWPASAAPVAPALDAGVHVTRKRPSPWPPIKLPLHIDNPFVPVNMTPTEDHVRQIVDLADQDECEMALARANAWLQSADGGGAPELRKRVLFTKVRCLRKLGRDDEAEQTARQR